MRLSGKQIEQIRQALLSGYTERELARMVRACFGTNLSVIVGDGNLQDKVDELISWAERTGQIEALVTGANEHNPTNPDLQRLIEDYSTWESDNTVPTQPVKDVPESQREQEPPLASSLRHWMLSLLSLVLAILLYVFQQPYSVILDQTCPAFPNISDCPAWSYPTALTLWIMAMLVMVVYAVGIIWQSRRRKRD